MHCRVAVSVSAPRGLARPEGGMVARGSKQNVALTQEHHCRSGWALWSGQRQPKYVLVAAAGGFLAPQACTLGTLKH